MNINVDVKAVWVEWTKVDGTVSAESYASVPLAQKAIQSIHAIGRVTATYIVDQGRKIRIQLPFSTL
jgi:hypothetical protein